MTMMMIPSARVYGPIPPVVVIGYGFPSFQFNHTVRLSANENTIWRVEMLLKADTDTHTQAAIGDWVAGQKDNRFRV